MGVRLPAAYQRVEYLENDGTQYIATNYVPATDYTDIDLVFAFTKSQDKDQMFFGSRNGADDKVWQCEYYSHGRWFVSNGMYKWRGALNGSTPDLNTRYKLSIYGDTFTVNGSSARTQTVATGSNNYPMYIFAWNNAGNAQFINVGARIYSLSFTENGKPAANFVPCVRISDSKPGMYDTVSGTFYTNSGSGEFIAGPDVIATEVSEWLMARRMGMMVPRGIPHDTFTFSLDGSIHYSDIAVPVKDFSVLFEISAGETGSSMYVDTTDSNNSNRYLQIAYYIDYFYLDTIGKRAIYSISMGYDQTVANRCAVSVYNDLSFIKYISDEQHRATGTGNSVVAVNLGTLRGNANKINTGNTVTVHLYTQALDDAALVAYITNGTIP